MSIYRAEYSNDAWALAILGDGLPMMVASTTRTADDDPNTLRAWMYAVASDRGDRLTCWGNPTAPTERKTLHGGTDADELERVFR